MDFGFYAEKMWYLINSQVKNPCGTAGLMGALYFASGLKPDFGWNENYRLFDENALTKEAMTDVKGDFRNAFIHDKQHFGIAGWSTWYRKQSLINYAAKEDRSLLASDIQVAFLLDELDSVSYGHVLEKLKETQSVEEAAHIVYDKYLDKDNGKTSMKELEECITAAKEIFKQYSVEKKPLIPVKYVKTDFNGVKIYRKPKTGKLSGLRRSVGKMVAGELYSYLGVAENGAEYIIDFNDKEGYVSDSKTFIVTRMVPEK